MINTRTHAKADNKAAVRGLAIGVMFLISTISGCGQGDDQTPRVGPEAGPNFLLILSDDQSWEHTSTAGYPLVSTPNFDRIAQEGVYFSHSYAAAPTCTASRSAILAGQPIWRLGSASMLWGYYSEEMISYQHLLDRAGYAVGFSGKGWGPGKIHPERPLEMPPTGIAYNKLLQQREPELTRHDLVANFEQFLDELPQGQAFSFWAGSTEPHRPYAIGQDRFDEPDAEDGIPPFLPDTPHVRKTLSAYLHEVEVFDSDVGKFLEVLRERGLLDNTVVIVTSDNGMPLSRAKAHNYEHGVRVPLAIRWGGIPHPGRTVEDFVNLADLAPTILALAGVDTPGEMTGNNLVYALEAMQGGVIDDSRDKTFTAFHRHSGYVRGGERNLTYPRRTVHTRRHLYIRNYFPDRWPAGDPPKYTEAYEYLLRDPVTKEPLQPYHALATQKRPAEELYDLQLDPGQLVNVAEREEYAAIKEELSKALVAELLRTEDPLQTSGADVFQQYKYIQPTSRKPTR